MKAKHSKNTLNPRQKKFIHEYLIDRNATQAAIRAGYSKKTANIIGPRQLSRVSVKAALDKALRRQEERIDMSADRVKKELAAIAFVDIRDAFDDNGNLKNITTMSENVARAVAGVDTEDLFEGVGRDREHIGYTKKLKMNDKLRALELLGKHHKMFTDRFEIDMSEDLAIKLASARKRVKGVDPEV